jgi:hypothetical protein
MPKLHAMYSTAHRRSESAMSNLTPWSLRAWPPVLWQAGRQHELTFRHLGTRVTSPGERTGQTMWGHAGAHGEAGVAWDWIELPIGAVAMADPMSVVTNLRLLGAAGEVLTAQEAARFLNEIVHTLPWQNEVQRALAAA